MFDSTFKLLFFIGLVLVEVIRFPFRKRNQRLMREKKIMTSELTGAQFAVDMLTFGAMELLPLVYLFWGWPEAADYPLPEAAGWIGAGLLALGLLLLLKAMIDLGVNWSPTLQIMEKHTLVTHGIYRYLRHPIYTSLWLLAFAQALMLPNWVVGPAGLVGALLVQLVRVPKEEAMMIDQFGDEYRVYRERTGGVLPKR